MILCEDELLSTECNIPEGLCFFYLFKHISFSFLFANNNLPFSFMHCEEGGVMYKPCTDEKIIGNKL